ncbi:MAG TPA: hypothetical protein VLJ15_08690 [Gammaproteobacteria bacterium]|nr:hypothetical protein [Gammaproteobacteria bacterium]
MFLQGNPAYILGEFHKNNLVTIRDLLLNRAWDPETLNKAKSELENAVLFGKKNWAPDSSLMTNAENYLTQIKQILASIGKKSAAPVQHIVKRHEADFRPEFKDSTLGIILSFLHFNDLLKLKKTGKSWSTKIDNIPVPKKPLQTDSNIILQLSNLSGKPVFRDLNNTITQVFKDKNPFLFMSNESKLDTAIKIMEKETPNTNPTPGNSKKRSLC